jgi:hypothetical protein
MKKLLERFAKAIEEHFSIGNLTVFGDNAMHFGCHFWTKKYGYICWRLPIPCGIADKIRCGDKLYWVPLYFYISRNATPWAAVFMLGKKHSPRDWALARVRKMHFGWNYNGDNDDHQYGILQQINGLR